jgi:MerR family mercuric resistance operon transcriptional regulator
MLSRRTGCHIETIRYYEGIGLMPAPRRSQGGHRLYDEEQLKRLTFIRRARELGFSLREIRGLLALVDGGNYSCRQVEALTLEHLDEVRSKITDLKKLERTLADIASQCNGGRVPECPVIDALFRDSHQGERPSRQ